MLLGALCKVALACSSGSASGPESTADGGSVGGSGASGGNGGIGGASGNGGVSNGCEVILNQADLDTGFERCDDGSKRRRAAIDCPTERTSTTSPCRYDFGSPPCAIDADCSREPLGYCADAHKLTGYCGCYYGCRRDSDCAAGSICECGIVIGRCVPATCKTNADCGSGFGCVASVRGTAGPTCITANTAVASTYACQTPADRCHGDMDCPSNGPNTRGACLLDGDHRACGTLCLLTP